jgi:hypothetical protein
MKRLAPILFTAVTWTSLAQAAPLSVLFVGNSYTFGRISPAQEYNAANVLDLTAAFNAIQPAGTNSHPVGTGIAPNPCVTPGTGCFEPHPWGGVPGIFKKLADQAGLDYDVSHSTRNAASLRGQFLQVSNSPPWKLRENVALQKWDVVILQEQSDAALPSGKGKNANLATFNAYADQFERFIHTGDVTGPDGVYTETELFGSLAACRATGLSLTTCNRDNPIPLNPNASTATKVYLQQTWARPDMVEAHKCTKADVTTMDGAPIVDSTCGGTNPNGNPATGQNFLYYTSQPTTVANLADMTTDLRNSFYGKVATNTNFAGVAPVGDAFQRAVNEGFAKGSGFYNAGGTYAVSAAPPINLWWIDSTHASKYGSYLSALVLFQTITGRNPLSLGAGEQAAVDLGIASDVAVELQRIAQATVGPDLSAPTTSATVNLPANANGWNNADVTVTLTATDNVNGSGVKQIAFPTTGAQAGTGIVNRDNASLTINVEGTTTITYSATDNAGNVEAAKTLVVRLDKTPPSFSGMPAAGCDIWPPNNKLVKVATVAAQDGLSGLASFNTDVASSEPASPGQSDATTTGTGLDPRTISVRATRLGNGPGRTYTLSASATDRAGNVTTAVATCVVPHDQGH